MWYVLLGVALGAVGSALSEASERKAQQRVARRKSFQAKFFRLPGDCLVDVSTVHLDGHLIVQYTPEFAPPPWQLRTGCDETGQEYFALQVHSEIEEYSCRIAHFTDRPRDVHTAFTSRNAKVLPKDGLFRNRWIHPHHQGHRDGGWFVVEISTDEEKWCFAHQSSFIPVRLPPPPPSPLVVETLELVPITKDEIDRLERKIDAFTANIEQMIEKAMHHVGSVEAVKEQFEAVGRMAKACEAMKAEIELSPIDESYKEQLRPLVDLAFDKEVVKLQRSMEQELEKAQQKDVLSRH